MTDIEIKIGFDGVRRCISELCCTHQGKECVRDMSFSRDYDAIMHSLQCVDEMRAIISASLPYAVPSQHNVLPYLSEIKAVNSFMSSERLHKLHQILMSFSEVRSFYRSTVKDSDEYAQGEFQYPHLARELENIGSFPQLISIIGHAVNKFGELKDTASPALYEIRQSIKRSQGSMQRILRSVLDRSIKQGIIDSDVTPAIRDGRMVIPVNAGNKREINGIVHDESATGKTVFIEPAEVVEAGNRLRELEMEEQREETRILIDIATSIRPHIYELEQSCLLLGRLDFIIAKARYATETDARMPHVQSDPELEWYHAVHPGLLLSLRSQDKSIVPLDIILTPRDRILIISGPNAGGKSVTLKTVAIVQYMMQCGVMPTLYENSHMGLFHNILIDIGDEQSIENELSTYSSHLSNMRYFLTHSDSHTLFLADEMGSGTEPQIGGAMAQAILSRLGKTGAYGVVTTHYQNLKTFADNTDGFVNGAMLYDRQHLQPMFRLEIGNPGSSFALDIAHKMGLPQDVIAAAKEIVGSDYVNMDKYLSDIARDRRYWNNKRQNIKEKEQRLDDILDKYEAQAGDLKSRRRAILDEARREAKEIVEGLNARIERTILEIRNTQAEKERTKTLRASLMEYVDSVLNPEKEKEDQLPKSLKTPKHKKKQPMEKDITPVRLQEKRPLTAGDYVTMDGSSMPGQILSISGKKAEVAFGALRTIVELSRLKPGKKPKVTVLGTTSGGVVSSDDSRNRQLNFNREIDVRGMRADEALQSVMYFLDDAIQFQADKVRILHGTGHGILKTLIRQQLKANPAVRSFGDEDVRFGGAGITVVDLE